MYGGRISYINRVRTMPRINPDYRREAREKIIAAALEIAAERGWDEVITSGAAKNCYAMFSSKCSGASGAILKPHFRRTRTCLQTSGTSPGSFSRESISV